MTRFVVLGASLLLAACGGGTEGGAENAPDPIATVRTAPVSTGAATDVATVYGTAEAGPGNERALAVQVEATLVAIVSPTGTAVRAGETVAMLEPTPTAQLDAVKAASDAATASAAYARSVRLRGDGLMSDADVETARAAAAAANATQVAAQQRASTLRLRAPVTGTIQALTAEPGDVVAAGTAIATIAAGGPLRAHMAIDPALALRVHAGQPIRLSAVDAAISFTAPIVGVDPQVDPTTHLASVFAAIPRAPGVGAGQSLRGTIALGHAASGLTIPYGALLDDGGRSYVFVVANGVARERDVAPGNSAGDVIQILRGLQPGEQVVTEGGTALEDGMKVKVQGIGR